MRKRKPLYGVAVHDTEEPPYRKENGKRLVCPYFRAWTNMLKRCYCKKYQDAQPTYKGCTVCDEWLTFSAFREWMQRQNWRGNELDKDLLVPGNKVYSPETCVFVSRPINSLLNKRRGTRLPQGVSWDGHAGKYRCEFTANGKKTYIGVFDCPQEAGLAYRKTKARHIKEVAKTQPALIRDALNRHAELMAC